MSQAAAVRNSKTKRSLRDALKHFYKTLEAGKPADVTTALNQAMGAIDSAAKKNIIHKNKAARQKARLSAAAKKTGVKLVAAKKVPAKPAAAKKVAPKKKPVAKKPAAKKAK